MKHVFCSQCHQSFGMNDTFLVLERQLCQACAEAELARHEGQELAENSVSRQVDPTVCAQCGADNRDDALPTIAGVPVCAVCEEPIRNRPYPNWLTLAFALLMALVVFCFYRNWRFIAAYREMQQMQRALKAGEFEKAADLSESAARHVPESDELAGMAHLNRGLVFMANDQSAQAVEAFKKARQSHANRGPFLDQLLLRAESGVAFEAGNYDEFLAKMQAMAAASPKDHTAVAGVASAYACKYSVSGSDEDRDLALKHLEEAERLAGPDDPLFKEYRARIQHRLDTRKVINRKEYMRRFPNGYSAGSK